MPADGLHEDPLSRDLEVKGDRLDELRQSEWNRNMAAWLSVIGSKEDLPKYLSFAVMLRFKADSVVELPPATADIIRQDLEEMFQHILESNE